MGIPDQLWEGGNDDLMTEVELGHTHSVSLPPSSLWFELTPWEEMPPEN